MNSNSSKLTQFIERSTQLRHDILLLSDLNELALSDASTEMSVDFEVWLADYDGPELADAFSAFVAMLRGWTLTWQGDDESALRGFSHAQCCCAWAYGLVGYVIATITALPTKGGGICCGTIEDAVLVGSYARKALTHAKHLTLSTPNLILH